VAIGGHVVEKHLTLSLAAGGPDSAFSLEPDEFKQMVDAIRTAEKALGSVNYGLTEIQYKSRALRRSLFAAKDIHGGEELTTWSIRTIRLANGLHPGTCQKSLAKLRHATINLVRYSLGRTLGIYGLTSLSGRGTFPAQRAR
jgi:sialic acid synthase SpsE